MGNSQNVSEDHGLVSAKVQANLSASQRADNFQRQLDSIPLRVRAQTAILTDAWTATGPDGADARSVAARVGRGRQLLPAYEATIDARYLLTRGFIGLMSTIGLEPSGDAFRYHDADVDLVPPDRLASSGSGAPAEADTGAAAGTFGPPASSPGTGGL